MSEPDRTPEIQAPAHRQGTVRELSAAAVSSQPPGEPRAETEQATPPEAHAAQASRADHMTATGPGHSQNEIDSAEALATAKFNSEVKRQMRQHTRRSFLIGGVAAGAGLAGWHWLRSRRNEDGLPWPFRRVLETNQELARDYFRPDRLAPAFPPEAARVDRVNGDVGLEQDVDLSGWRLTVEGLARSAERAMLTLDDVKKLPRIEMTTELKCIEGWSVVVRWAGARFSDFVNAYSPASPSDVSVAMPAGRHALPPYVGMETPDGSYYVGLEMESMLHPQTLLCYEMNGAPLTQEHGAPLRLVIPVKYGVKNIKRIGKISYKRHRPADYWAEQGYDWYIGL
jgi:DMSO/TMAO reductase YedYZ molybdopterin-dependent catalytic subunit